MDLSTKVRITCTDGEVEVDQDIAEKSVIIKGLIDDSGPFEIIPLAYVKCPILEKVFDFFIHQKVHRD